MATQWQANGCTYGSRGWAGKLDADGNGTGLTGLEAQGQKT
jgi:hypothetical protein